MSAVEARMWRIFDQIHIGHGTMTCYSIHFRAEQKSVDPWAITVQVGDEVADTNSPRCVEIFPVDLVVPHPDYDINLEDNDIGLLVLSREIDLVGKPCACKLCMKDKEPRAGDVCVVAGYGQAREQAGKCLFFHHSCRLCVCCFFPSSTHLRHVPYDYSHNVPLQGREKTVIKKHKKCAVYYSLLIRVSVHLGSRRVSAVTRVCPALDRPPIVRI